MIKNRTAQLVFQTVYCTLGLIGMLANFGIFDDISNIRWDFYVHFTNLSNVFCLIVMAVALVQTVRKKEDSYVSALPKVKFIGILTILLTFVIFNGLLAGAEGRDPQLNWRIGSLTFHVVLPILYVLDWFLFYERRKTKWYYPFMALLFPAVYAVFIYTQAAILRFDTSILIPNTTTPLIYPYFFLDLDKQGVLGVAFWFLMIFIVYVPLGYAFFGLDRLLARRKKGE